MAQPKIDVEQIQHLLNGAQAHRETFNKSFQDLQVGQAIVMALLLVAQELDQIADALAVMANLKDPEQAEIT